MFGACCVCCVYVGVCYVYLVRMLRVDSLRFVYCMVASSENFVYVVGMLCVRCVSVVPTC